MKVGDRVELISRAYCDDIPIGARGSIAYITNKVGIGDSAHVIWDSLKGTVLQGLEIADSLRILTEEEIQKEHESTKTWYDAIREFTPSEMLAFLQDVEDGSLGDRFCSSMCQHKDEESCEPCKYLGIEYLSEMLKMSPSKEYLQIIQRKAGQIDVQEENRISQTGEE